jgi:hypothetical protein
MAITDLVGLVEQRLRDISKQNPSMTTKEFFFSSEEGLFCLITVMGSAGNEIEYNFIESETSWKRPEAVLEYNQATLDGLKVAVIVPDEALADVMILVKNYDDGRGVIVTDYSAMGLIPMPLTY